MTNRQLVRDLIRTKIDVDRLETTEVPGNFTAGSVLFAKSTGRITQDNTNFFWDDTNNRLGIGIASPNMELDVRSAGTSYTGAGITNTDGSTRQWALLASNNAGTYAPSKGFGIRDVTGGATRFVIDTSGNVGIGTTAPAAKLDVMDGYIRAREGANNAPTTGAGLELIFPSGGSIGHVQAYNRTSSAWQQLVLGGSRINLGTSGTIRAYFDASNNRTLVLTASNSEYIGFNDSGNTERFVMGLEHAGERFIFYNPTQGYLGNWSYSTGYLRIGDGTAPSYRVELPNTASAAGQGRANAWVTYSSRSFKRNIRPIDPQTRKQRFRSLATVQYEIDLTNEEGSVIGQATDVSLIAEDVAQVWPELVAGNPDEPETIGLKLDRIGVVLLPEVQEHDERLDALETLVQTLQTEIATLKQKGGRP